MTEASRRMAAFSSRALERGGGEDALARDWTLSAEDVGEVLRGRGADHRLRFAVELCALRAQGRFVEDPAAVPLAAVNFLARQLGLAPVLFLAPAERAATESAQRQRLCTHLGLRGFEPDLEEDLRRHLEEQATEGRTPAELLVLAEARLRRAGVVLPAITPWSGWSGRRRRGRPPVSSSASPPACRQAGPSAWTRCSKWLPASIVPPWAT